MTNTKTPREQIEEAFEEICSRGRWSRSGHHAQRWAALRCTLVNISTTTGNSANRRREGVMSDSLGDRMKAQYEDRTRYFLPRRTYTILRVDGKAFHTYTRGCEKPFDQPLINAMLKAGIEVCRDVMGVEFGYHQSDEISFLLTDFANTKTEAYFDGNIQKIVSVAASIMTSAFNEGRSKSANFDARVFTIPDYVEVENYFLWRQKDWERNSLQMLCRAHFSHKQLHGKGSADMHEMLHGVGVNWAELPAHHKNGSVLRPTESGWISEAAPNFASNRQTLTDLIPKHWEART